MCSYKGGSWSSWQDVDEEVKNICSKVKPCVEEKTRESFTIFEPLTFRSQVVKGMNYDIVLYTGKQTCLQMRVWQDVAPVKLNVMSIAVFPLLTVSIKT
ncbi:stefin-C-like [Electrophorus electricus]|uniref:stefin-C-like n=1 Tax=Electrophorus electricus TaxID=8005 RepID=UPI0015D05274|nr:stefin-C-like [Electrophorus electricus]